MDLRGKFDGSGSVSMLSPTATAESLRLYKPDCPVRIFSEVLFNGEIQNSIFTLDVNLSDAKYSGICSI